MPGKKRTGYNPRSTGYLTPTQAAAVKEVVKGEYTLLESWNTGQTYTQGTEVTPWYYDAAAGADRLFAWMRFTHLWASVAGALWMKWFVIRWKTADGVPNVNDGPTLERLRSDGRILKRGLVFSPASVYGKWGGAKILLRNVRVPAGESLGLVVVNLSTTRTDVIEGYLGEYREIDINV